MTATTTLVGRERELAALRERLAAALTGRGALVLIGGEAGIGKTALAEALCQEATERGALVLVGRCYDLSETPPYGPWVDLFGRYRPGADAPPAPAAFARRGTVGAVAGQGALLEQVAAFLTDFAPRRPVVLLLDDLHWADPASLDLLRAVARDAATLPLLLVATYRADELTRRHPLYALLPTLVRETQAARLDLRRLTAEDCRDLVGLRYRLGPADADRLVAALEGRAEGNPFYLGELLRALEEHGALRPADGGWALHDPGRVPIPPLLRQVIDGRVARLGEEMRDLLGVAAVLGQEVPLAPWALAAEADEEALLAAVEAAAEARLLIELPDGLGVRFAHALIREAVYAGLSPARRRRLHRRVAETLAARPQPDPDAVAMHFQRAGDERAADWLVRAGERAQLAYAWLTAIERYEAALATLEGGEDDPTQQGWLRYRIARLRRYSTPRQGIEYLDEALRLAALAGDRVLAAAARYSRGVCLSYEAEHAAAIREMAAGCDALEALPPVELGRLDLGPDAAGLPTVANPRGYLVAILAGTGRIAEALAMGEGLREGLPRHTPLGELAWAHHGDRHGGLGMAHALAGHPDVARAAYATARGIFRTLGNHSTLGVVAIGELLYVVLPYRANRGDEIRHLIEEATAARARASGSITHYVGLARIPALALAGEWAAARAEAEAAQWLETGRFRDSFVRPWLCELARGQGEPDIAWAQIRGLLPNGSETAPGDLLFFDGLALLRSAAALCLDAADLPGARAWLEAHDRWLAWGGAVLGRSEGQALWARYHRQAGDRARAQEHATAAMAHASEPRQPLALLAARRLLGELATAAGQHTEAAAHLAASLALADACAAPYERALSLLALAELRLSAHEPDGARLALDEACAILAPLEARPALARADALAARLAAPAAPPTAHPAGLSAREVEVLRLVAQGLTDAQVAERLFLSPRTVGTHLRSIYNKLGVDNRTAAVAFAIDHGLR